MAAPKITDPEITVPEIARPEIAASKIAASKITAAGTSATGITGSDNQRVSPEYRLPDSSCRSIPGPLQVRDK